MGDIKSYQDLVMWQKAKDLAVLLYRTTEKFPASELYGLTSQIRRAGVSIASNIAEGFRRKSPKEKIQFLRISYGSSGEVETQLSIAQELGYLTGEEYEALVAKLQEIEKMIHVVINRL